MGHLVGGNPVFDGRFNGKTEIQINKERDLLANRDVFYVQEICYTTNPPYQTRHGPFTQEEMLAVVKLLTAKE